ncbi:MAG: MerR family transcriptional regulator [Acidimicrobiales bacterium]
MAADLDGIGTCGIAEDVARMEINRPLFVSEVAHHVGLSPHTLRWYVRVGLLKDVPRGLAGHRRYSAPDVEWLLFVRLRATDMPVKDMVSYAEMVRAGEHTAELRAQLLERHRARVVGRIEALQADLGVIDQKITGYRGRPEPRIDPVATRRPSQQGAGGRTAGFAPSGT